VNTDQPRFLNSAIHARSCSDTLLAGERCGRLLLLSSPSGPAARYRSIHFRSVGREMPHCRQTCVQLFPCSTNCTHRNRFPISVPIRYRVTGNDVY
jgi:hypothetical protein